MGEIRQVAITGANGFLGSYVVEQIIKEGFTPVLILRKNSDLWRISHLISKVHIFRMSGDESEVEELLDLHEIDCIIHLATEYGRDCPMSKLLNSNVIFPLTLIEGAQKRGLKLFINTDTFFAKSEFDQGYLKDYTNSKRILEKLLIDFKDRSKIVNLRLEHVFGENDSENKFFTSVIKALIQNEQKIDLTEGQQKRDFVYAGDAADAYISVIREYDGLDEFSEFEVGSGRSITVRTFVEKLAREVDSETKLRFGALASRQGEISDSYAKNEGLKKIGWSPKYTIEMAIDRIIKKEKERFKL